ncbi:MAG: methionyl-tRNA formyltransferase [Candidatus Dasytiphilus stammeri]
MLMYCRAKGLKIIFAGTGEFTLYHLTNLLSQHQIVGILTYPDANMTGKINQLVLSRIKEFALKHKISLFQIKSEDFYQINFYKKLVALKSDLMVVIAYGIKLPSSIINIPKLGCINVHSSLLPRWRGAAPIPRSIIAGDKITGVTTIQINSGIDTGDILHKIPCAIEHIDTSASLSQKLSKLGSISMLITLQQFLHGTKDPQAQSEHLATYAKKILKKEAQLNWKLSAIELERYIRAFNPWPICYFFIHGKYIKVWKASVLQSNKNSLKTYQPGEIIQANKKGIQIATGQDFLNLEQLQLAGKNIMTVNDFLNSRQKWFTPGLILD